MFCSIFSVIPLALAVPFDILIQATHLMLVRAVYISKFNTIRFASLSRFLFKTAFLVFRYVLPFTCELEELSHMTQHRTTDLTCTELTHTGRTLPPCGTVYRPERRHHGSKRRKNQALCADGRWLQLSVGKCQARTNHHLIGLLDARNTHDSQASQARNSS